MRLPRIARTLLLLSLLAPSAVADDTSSAAKPVTAVADHLLKVSNPAKGQGDLPLYISIGGASADWTHPQPSVTRALIVFHGELRNAAAYNTSGLTAIRNAGATGETTLLITPQFLAQVDADTFHLPSSTLRWAPDAWMAGENALNSQLSSFDAIDAIFVHLNDRKLFPNLKNVVLAGYSGGAQLVQLYAVAGGAPDFLTHTGIHVRYVVANPSSYVYFSTERPELYQKTQFAFSDPANNCNKDYDHWKYGSGNPPPYIGDASFVELEQRYVKRNVIYLLGANDTDPNQPALDKTCPAEDQGPTRFYRGNAYFSYLENQYPELANTSAAQQLWLVPGVGHDSDSMLNSTCGLAALFSIGTCDTRVFNPKPLLDGLIALPVTPQHCRPQEFCR